MNTQLPPPRLEQAPPPPPQYAPPGFQSPYYVIQHKSRHGIGGWLGVWMVMFVFGAITYIPAFIAELTLDDKSPANLVFLPVLATLCIASVVLIAARRRLGKAAAIAALATTWLFATIKILAGNGSAAANTSGILVLGVIQGALVLYFLQADRVRQTLIN
jgi:hypothetical protein